MLPYRSLAHVVNVLVFLSIDRKFHDAFQCHKMSFVYHTSCCNHVMTPNISVLIENEVIVIFLYVIPERISNEVLYV